MGIYVEICTMLNMLNEKIMKNLILGLLSVLLSCYSVEMKAQVNIGSLDNPHDGSVLDLSQSGLDRGLLLPHVALTDIKVFQLIDAATITDDQKRAAKGMLVYNTTVNPNASLNEGMYVWDGHRWAKSGDFTGSVCTPVRRVVLMATSNTYIQHTSGSVSFTVFSDGSDLTNEQQKTYKWYVEKDNMNPSALFTETDYTVDSQTIPFAAPGIYYVKVEAENCFAGAPVSSEILSVIVTPDVTTVDNYSLNGETCYDVKMTKNADESDEDFNARENSFENGYIKSYSFGFGEVYYDLSFAVLEDNAGVISSVSQPSSDKILNTTGQGANVPLCITFNNNVREMVKGTSVNVKVAAFFRQAIDGAIKAATLDMVVKDANCCSSVVYQGYGDVNYSYRTRMFGSAGCWMTENLATSAGLNITKYKIPGNDEIIAKNGKYGYFYSWNEAMGGSPATDILPNPKTEGVGDGGQLSPYCGHTPSSTQGICPPGWVIPSDYDWNELEKEITKHAGSYSNNKDGVWYDTWDDDYTVRNEEANGHGQSMKSEARVVSTTASNGKSLPNGKGFNALLTGYTTSSNTNPNLGTNAYFFTSSRFDINDQSFVSREVRHTSTGVYRQAHNSLNNNYMSVRCKKKN
jgi:uncharacterized protein (TIGR02145 family)